MPEPFKKLPLSSPKFYFVYFIIFSIIVLLIFSFMIVGYYWNYWSLVKNMENYYKNRLSEIVKVFPKVNPNDPILGQPDAAVTIFEYSDFTCPNCYNIQADLLALEKFYGNRLRIVFKGMPITNNLEARPALISAYCANEQGKFWEYKDLLFPKQSLLTLQLYRETANQLQLNLDQFNTCLEDKKFNQILDQNAAEAISLQISSLPTVYVNDQKVEGYFNYTTLKNIIEKKIQ